LCIFLCYTVNTEKMTLFKAVGQNGFIIWEPISFLWAGALQDIDGLQVSNHLQPKVLNF
jgi:hypothetical protein